MCSDYPQWIDTVDSTIQFPGQDKKRLTSIEMQIMWVLLKAGGRPVHKDVIISKVWGGYSTHDSLAHRIQCIRRKVGNDKVLTVYGYGYRLGVPILS